MRSEERRKRDPRNKADPKNVGPLKKKGKYLNREAPKGRDTMARTTRSKER